MANKKGKLTDPEVDAQIYRVGYLSMRNDWLEASERAEYLENVLRRIKSIGARSGTDINAWNKAFDVIDEVFYGSTTVKEGD